MSSRGPTAGPAVRIGILGAARIAPMALIDSAKENREVVVAAVAARDVRRAQAFAATHGIGCAYGDYEALIADPDVDAIYNPLPNGLHGRWTRAALAAGKHVLCEKPFTANAAEAREIAALADDSGRVVMEAFHYRYHPLTLRAPVKTTPQDAVDNMTVIDAIYRAAGLPLRHPA